MSTTPPPPNALPTQYFFIRSAESTDSSLGLVIGDDQTVSLQPWGGGIPQELWQLVDQGPTFSIVSASSAGTTPLYLAPSQDSGGASVIVTATEYGWVIPAQWNNAIPDGLPDFQIAGPILTPDSSLSVTAQQSGAPVVVEAAESGASSQTWQLFPEVMHSVPPQSPWLRIESQLTDDENNVYVLDLLNGGTVSGTQVMIELPQNQSTTQLWRFTPDGHIANFATVGNALSLGGPYINPPAGNWCIVNTWTNTDQTQLWTRNANGTITNVGHTPNTLYADGPSGAPNVPTCTWRNVDDPGAPPTDGQLFTTIPYPTLIDILAADPVPLPPFTSGTQPAAYAYINQQLGVTDVRAEYLNQSEDLNSLAFKIENLQCPPYVEPADWTYVTQQLESELTNAGDVRQLFSNYDTYHQALFSEDNGIVAGLITAANMSSAPGKTNGIALNVMEGALYTLLSINPATGVVANLAHTAMSASLAARTTSVNPFSVAVSELWQTMVTSFEAVLDQAGIMAAAILSDWGKMQAVYTAINESGPQSLAWPSDDTQSYIDASTSGFTLACLQMLLPAQYQLYYKITDDNGPDKHIPASCQFTQGAGSGLYRLAYIASNTDWSTYPYPPYTEVDFMTDYVWNNYPSNQQQAAKVNFFNDSYGWNFPMTDYSSNVGGGQNVVMTVSNETGLLLSIDTWGTGMGNDPVVFALPPYGSANIIAVQPPGRGGAQFTAKIYDPSGAEIASFEVQQEHVNFEGEWPQVLNLWVADGYQFSTPVSNQGSAAHYPGAAQITLMLTGS